MTVRPSCKADRDELVRMREALWPDSEPGEVDLVLERPSARGVVLVVEATGGGLAGFAEVGVRPYADGCRSSPVAYLEGLWVDPGARRSGVALALVREVEEWARGAGFVELASDCELGNDSSEAFHRAAGFDEVQRSICFRRDLTVKDRR